FQALESTIPCIGMYYRKQGDSMFHPMEQVIPCHGTKCSTPWNKQEGAGSVGLGDASQHPWEVS
ncbi:MAG: hypothetical protein J6I37_10735, partial [Prevotella sp.]|nr:hypothetical protein [Prevotella sp.]